MQQKLKTKMFIIVVSRIRFLYDHIVKGEADPKDIASICDKIIKENIALVKIEMAAKALTR